MNKAYRQKIAGDIAALIRQKRAPWQQPWQPTQGYRLPYNAATKRSYRGGNALLLMLHAQMIGGGDAYDPRWCTFKQANAQGWKIKRGAKATTVEYWRTEEEKTVEDEATGLKKKIRVKLEHPKVAYLNLFHASQIEGIQDQETLFSREVEPLVSAKRILEGSRANIVHREGKMAYSPKTDQLILPPPESFSSAEEYHAAALRGLVAWSGHASRLGALSVNPADPQAYVKKNLRIHLAGWYLAQKVGLPYAPSANQEEMYEHWAKLLEFDAQELVTAARDAEKIVAYIMELGKEQELQSTVEQEIAPSIAPKLRAFRSLWKKDIISS